MKKVLTYIMLLSVGSATFVSCGAGKNVTKGVLDSANVGGTVVKTDT